MPIQFQQTKHQAQRQQAAQHINHAGSAVPLPERATQQGEQPIAAAAFVRCNHRRNQKLVYRQQGEQQQHEFIGFTAHKAAPQFMAADKIKQQPHRQTGVGHKIKHAAGHGAGFHFTHMLKQHRHGHIADAQLQTQPNARQPGCQLIHLPLCFLFYV